MGGIDLTIKGNGASKKRMVTDQTLDREGFFIPEPPQRCDRRIRSAVGIGRKERDQKPFGNFQSSFNRPKSANFSNYNKQVNESNDKDINQNQNMDERENQEDFSNLMITQKMSVNQKWVYEGECTKWKPRNSQVPVQDKPASWSNSKKKDVKQRISVCEVMAKMKSGLTDSKSAGAAAPPSSPKTSTSAIIGRRFVNDRPTSPRNGHPVYLKYAKSRSRSSQIEAKNRKSFSYLQEDMTVTNHPSGQDVIEIPTMDMFSTDEPDEESVAMVQEPTTGPRPATRTQADLYKSVYLKDYREYPSSQYRDPRDHVRLDRPKSDNNYVRYCPDTYRFHDQRYTKDMLLQKDWDRVQPRAPTGNTKVVSTRRPASQSLYVGVS